MSMHLDPDELRELEHRLTERLDAIAPRPRPVAAERVRTEISMTSQRRSPMAWLRGRLPEPSWSRIATVGGVAVVALVVGIAIGTSGVFHVGKSPEPSPSGPVSSHPPFGESWQQVSVEPADTPGDYVVEGGYAGATRTVLVGQVAGPAAETLGHTTPAAWYSDDDVTWHRSQIRLESLSPVEAYDISVVFPSASVLYGIGTGGVPMPEGGMALTSIEYQSVDGGATWTQMTRGTSPAAVVRDVVAGGPGFLAVGDSGTATNPQIEIFTSTDGVTWSGLGDPPTGQPAGVDPGGTLAAVAEHDGTLMAVGLRAAAGGGLVLTSRDGVSWQSLPVPHGMVARDVTWSSGAWIVVGSGPDPTDPPASVPSAWRSTDGRTWTQVPMDAQGATHAASVSGSGWGIVAAGDEGQHAVAWTSGAGGTWQSHALDAGPFATPEARLALVTPRGLLVAGNGRSPSFARLPLAWFSPTSPDATPPAEPATGTPTPAPTPTPESVPSTAPLPASPIFSTWQRVDLPDPAPDEFGGTTTRGVAHLGDRWIAVGSVNGGCCAGGYSEATRGVIWTSADGEHWALVPPQDSLAHARIYSVATNGTVIVAVGIVEVLADDGSPDPLLQPASWYSTNGTTWHLVGNAPSLALVTAAGGRFVAASDVNQMVSFYASADGRSWVREGGIGPGSLAPDAVVRVSSLAGAPDGSVTAIGFVGTNGADGYHDEMTVWTSPGPDLGIEMSQWGVDGSMATVVYGNGAWLSTVLVNRGDGTILQARSARELGSWSAPVVVESSSRGFLTSAALAAGDAVVVVGSGPDAVTVPGGETAGWRAWVRVGSAWYQVVDATLQASGAEISSMAWDESGSRILAAGSRWDGTHPVPVVLVALR